MPRRTCEHQREQTYSRPSNRNLTGSTWRKCRRKVIGFTTMGRAICKGCFAEGGHKLKPAVRCPTCADIVENIFEHIDIDCKHP